MPIKHRVIQKLARALLSRASTRLALIERLLKNHISDVVAAISREHLPEVITALCRDHLPEVITQVNGSGGGSFKYVGEDKIKIVIGSGSQRLPGWLSTDINMLNITHGSAWRNLFNPNSIDNILAEHVIEHLSQDEFHAALEHAHTYLKLGGIFRIAVPDAFHPSRYYYNLVKPSGWETPLEHKLFFDHEMLTRIADESGYKIRPLEYFDESGIFHKENYSQDDGAIQRCAANNRGLDTSDEKVMEKFYSTIPQHLRQQFYDKKMTYTSLIIDLIR